MQCDAVVELLLAEEAADGAAPVGAAERDPRLRQHLASCPSCAHLAEGLARVDRVLTANLVVAPPPALQAALAQLVDEAVAWRRPWWARLLGITEPTSFSAWFMGRPHVIAAQGLAAVMLALATWQVFSWLSMFQPVVGDIGYALQLVVSSPASAYFGGLQIDLQSLGAWSLVGLAGWLVSENGLVGGYLSGLNLP